MSIDSSTHLTSLVITITLIIISLVTSLVAILLMVQKQQQRKQLEFRDTIVAEKENMMQSISMEVHDHICQMLYLLRFEIQLDIELTATATAVKNQKLTKLLDILIADSKNICYSLNPAYFKTAILHSALQEKVRWLNQSGRVKCSLNLQGDSTGIDPTTEMTLLRIAQEALNNTARHAAAENVAILLHYQQKAVQLIIIDDGRGFEPESPARKAGIGLRNMQQRADMIRAKLYISVLPGKGTLIRVWAAKSINTRPA